MKRIVVKLIVASLLFGVLLASTGVSAFAVFPAPADGQRVALSVDNPRVYEYPVSSGTWYIDGFIRNNRYVDYSAGVNVVSPHTTVEYLDDSDVVVGSQTFEVPVHVLECCEGLSSFKGGYFRVFHQEIDVPAGANPTKTRFAVEVPTSDPPSPGTTTASPREAQSSMQIHWVAARSGHQQHSTEADPSSRSLSPTARPRPSVP